MTKFSYLGLDNVTELLIQNNADVNVADSQGNTALMCGAEKGKTEFLTETYKPIGIVQ